MIKAIFWILVAIIIFNLMPSAMQSGVNSIVVDGKDKVTDMIQNRNKEDLRSLDQIQCENATGVWKEFSDNCADFCSSQRDSYEKCDDLKTWSCDCGIDRCWNWENCETG